jgi:Bacterial regulatory proteins, tetR family
MRATRSPKNSSTTGRNSVVWAHGLLFVWNGLCRHHALPLSWGRVHLKHCQYVGECKIRKHVKSTTKTSPGGRPEVKPPRRPSLDAARELLGAGGLGAVTMEGVAARAGVGKRTVYRWWPDRHAVAMAALMEGEGTHLLEATRRSAVAALREQLRAITQRFLTKTGRHITSMIAASDPTSELSKKRSQVTLFSPDARKEECC